MTLPAGTDYKFVDCVRPDIREMIDNPAFNDPPEDVSLLPTRLARGMDAEYENWILDRSTRTFSEFLADAPRVFDVHWCMCDGKNMMMCPHHWEKQRAKIVVRLTEDIQSKYNSGAINSWELVTQLRALRSRY